MVSNYYRSNNHLIYHLIDNVIINNETMTDPYKIPISLNKFFSSVFVENTGGPIEADNTQSSSTDDIVITEDGVFLSC